MFKLNKQDALSYDQRGGYINQAGKYNTVIESAVWYIGNSYKGRSENLKLTVVSEQKQKATFYINTSYSDGIKNEGGHRTISAILACLRMHETGNPVPTAVKEYSQETQREETVMRDCFVQLHGRHLGIIVQMVHEDGRDNPSPTLYSVFEAGTELTAGEILTRKEQPEQLGKIMAHIINKPLIDKRSKQTAHEVPPPPTRRDTIDDIPY